MAAEDAAVRSRLSAVMEARRLELDLSWDKVAKRAGISIAHLRRVRGGDVTLTAKAKWKIEQALLWNRGSIDLVLAGKDPEPAPDPSASGELEPWEAHLWQTPQLSESERRQVIGLARTLLERPTP